MGALPELIGRISDPSTCRPSGKHNARSQTQAVEPDTQDVMEGEIAKLIDAAEPGVDVFFRYIGLAPR